MMSYSGHDNTDRSIQFRPDTVNPTHAAEPPVSESEVTKRPFCHLCSNEGIGSQKNPPPRNQPTQRGAEREGPPTKGGPTPGTVSFLRFRPRPSDHSDEMMIAEGSGIFVGKTKNGVCMRYLKPDSASRNGHLSSDRWRSMLPGWHKMW